MNNSVDNPGARYSTKNLTKTRDQLQDLLERARPHPGSGPDVEALEVAIDFLSDTVATLTKSRQNQLARRRAQKKRQRSKKRRR